MDDGGIAIKGKENKPSYSLVNNFVCTGGSRRERALEEREEGSLPFHSPFPFDELLFPLSSFYSAQQFATTKEASFPILGGSANFSGIFSFEFSSLLFLLSFISEPTWLFCARTILDSQHTSPHLFRPAASDLAPRRKISQEEEAVFWQQRKKKFH